MSLFFHCHIPGHYFTSLSHYPCTFTVAEVVPGISALPWIFWTLLSEFYFTALDPFGDLDRFSQTWVIHVWTPSLFVIIHLDSQGLLTTLTLHQPTCLPESYLTRVTLNCILYCTKPNQRVFWQKFVRAFQNQLSVMTMLLLRFCYICCVKIKDYIMDLFVVNIPVFTMGFVCIRR